MAKSDVLHDNPRSPKGEQKAERGDVKTGKELAGEDIGTDDEYESIGRSPRTLPKGDPRAGSAEEHDEADEAAEKWRKARKNREKFDGPTFYDLTTKGQGETWRKKKKEVPTS